MTSAFQQPHERALSRPPLPSHRNGDGKSRTGIAQQSREALDVEIKGQSVPFTWVQRSIGDEEVDDPLSTRGSEEKERQDSKTQDYSESADRGRIDSSLVHPRLTTSRLRRWR